MWRWREKQIAKILDSPPRRESPPECNRGNWIPDPAINVVCVFLAPRRCFLSSRGFPLDGCSLLSLTEEDGVRNIRDGCRIAMKVKVTLVPQPESTRIKSIKGWRKSYIGASDSQPEPSCLGLCKEPWHQTGVCNIQLTNL